MAATVKEEAESVFLSFLKNCRLGGDEKEQTDVLHAAQRGFMILSHDPRSYATIMGK
jgi:hypothetical protein